MNVTLLQLDCQWRDAPENIRRAGRLMDSLPPADLYLLPEMWATGFDVQPGGPMAAAHAEALAWMCREAAVRRCAVGGSLAVPPGCAAGGAGGAGEQTPAGPEAAGLWRNRFYLAGPDGSLVCYDKRHLFAYGGEHRHYAAGTARVTADCGGLRLMLQTCFDLRFPESARNFLPQAYDVLLYVASWPASRRAAWNALLRARAIENQAYCIGVNRTGADPACLYDGGSAAYGPNGEELLLLDSREQAATVAVDAARLRHLRQKFPVLLSEA